MPASALFNGLLALLQQRSGGLRVGYDNQAFPSVFVRDGVIHARRAGSATTVATDGPALVIRTWAFNAENLNDPAMVDLAAETRMADSPEPDLYDRVEVLRESGEIEQIFEVGMLLVQHANAARQVAKFPELFARIPGLRLFEAGGVAPYWAEGDWHGYRVTFRARYQTVRLSIHRHDDSANALWMAEYTDPEDLFFASALSDEEFVQFFLDLASRLERAPFAYKFEDLSSTPRMIDVTGRAVPNLPFIGWGHSPAEARAMLLDHFREIYSEEDPELNISVLPVNRDERVFPEATPPFRVLPA